MKLNTLQATTFKGGNFVFRPGPVTVIYGGNFEGKSRVLDAIRVAFHGYHPTLGKKKTSLLGADGNFSIMAAFDGGICQHTYTGKKDAVINFPEDFSIPNVLLDFRQFLGLTGPERVNLIMKQIDLEKQDFNEAKVTSALRALKAEEPNEHHEAAINDIVAKVMELSKARAEEDASMQEWLDGVTNEVKAIKKAADESVKQMAGTQKGLTQLATQSAEAPPRAKAIVDADLTRLRAEKSTADTKAGELSAGVDTWERNAKRRGELDGKLKAAVNNSDEIARLKKLAEDLEKDSSGYVSQTKAAYKSVCEATSLVNAKHAAVKRVNDEKADAVAEFDKTVEGKCCPTCDSKTKAWRESYKAKHERLMASYDADLATLATELGAATQTLERAEQAHADCMARDTKIEDFRTRAKNHRETISRLQDEQRDFEKLTAERKGLDALGDKPDETELATLRANIARLNMNIGMLETEQRRAIQAGQDALRKAQAERDRASAEAKKEIAALALKKLMELQKEAIDTAIGALMGVARKFTDGILKTPLEFREGEFGRWQGTQWIPCDDVSFSGTEQAIAFAGLSVALAQGASCKVVLMDELGRVDVARKPLLIQRMVDLTEAGVIDHFVGVDVAERDYLFATHNKAIALVPVESLR
jgi:hypothetical protein